MSFSKIIKTFLWLAFFLLAYHCNQLAENEVEYTFQGKITGKGSGHLPPPQGEVIPCDINFKGVYGNTAINGGNGVNLTTTPYPENFTGSTTILEIRELIKNASSLPVTFSPAKQIKGRITGLTTFSGSVSQRAFYVQDATAGIFVFASNNVISSSIAELGKEITMTVTQGDKFNGSLQITGSISSFTLNVSTDPLYVKDIFDDSIVHEGELVRFCGYVFNKKPFEFSVSGRPSVYYGGSNAGLDDLYILDLDYVTVLGPLTSYNGKTQVNLSAGGAYPANLSTYVLKHARKFLKVFQVYPEPNDEFHLPNLSVSVTFDYPIPSLTMSQYFTVRQNDCSGPIVSVGEPTSSLGNRKFTYNLSLSPNTTYATCVSSLLYDSEGKYLEKPLNFTWKTGESNYNKIVISQFYVHGGNSGATYKQDFVEIFNRSNSSVNLANWSIQYQSGNSMGPYSSIFPLPNIDLAPGEYYLIRCASSGNNGSDIASADNTSCSLNFSTSGGKIALVKTTKPIWHDTPLPTGYISDLVGYTSTNQSEGSAVSTPTATTSRRRNSGGCTDSDNNSADLGTYSLTGTQSTDLRNLSSSPNVCP